MTNGYMHIGDFLGIHVYFIEQYIIINLSWLYIVIAFIEKNYLKIVLHNKNNDKRP